MIIIHSLKLTPQLAVKRKGHRLIVQLPEADFVPNDVDGLRKRGGSGRRRVSKIWSGDEDLRTYVVFFPLPFTNCMPGSSFRLSLARVLPRSQSLMSCHHHTLARHTDLHPHLHLDLR